MERKKMLLSEKIFERMDFYGINCKDFEDDVKFIFEEMRGKEGKRKGEVLEILKREKGGIEVRKIGEELGLKGPNVNSIIMELRKGGIEILSINRKMILGDYVNIG